MIENNNKFYKHCPLSAYIIINCYNSPFGVLKKVKVIKNNRTFIFYIDKNYNIFKKEDDTYKKMHKKFDVKKLIICSI